MSTVQEEIGTFSSNYKTRLANHPTHLHTVLNGITYWTYQIDNKISDASECSVINKRWGWFIIGCSQPQ